MADRLAGAATPEGTLRGAESFAEGARALGRTRLTVSPVGFGGYRVSDEVAAHRRALADALRAGVNLVDTSTNYGDGRSERLVGNVLTSLVQRGELRREHVVVVSKVGYVQGSNLARVRARPHPFPEMVEVGSDCWHCIHPEFVRAQVEESLARLGLERIDVLLLHNPEYFLEVAARAGDAGARERYEARLRSAFDCLEQLVGDGRIGAYGVSSNGFPLAEDEVTHTSLHRAIELAREVGGDDHRFAVAQMPINLLELGAMTERHAAARGRTALEVAGAADVGVLANRPLNAIAEVGGRERLVRLAAGATPDAAAAIGDALAQVRKLEAQWADGLGRALRTEDGRDDAVDLFRWGQELARRMGEIADLATWQRVHSEVIGPHLGRTSAELLATLEGNARVEFARWWTAYGTALGRAFEAIEARLARRRRDVALALEERLNPHLPERWRGLPLSLKALLTVLSTPIASVLVGMRQSNYVVDVLALREHPIRLVSAALGPVDVRAVSADLSAVVREQA